MLWEGRGVVTAEEVIRNTTSFGTTQVIKDTWLLWEPQQELKQIGNQDFVIPSKPSLDGWENMMYPNLNYLPSLGYLLLPQFHKSLTPHCFRSIASPDAILKYLRRG